MPKKITDVSRKILDAALQIYHEEGFEQISMRRVAARSGLAVGTVYNRFEDKEALLAQVLAGDIEQIKGAMMENVFGKPPRSALYAAIYTFVARAMHQSHDIVRYVLDLPPQKAYVRKILTGACGQIKQLVQEILTCVYRECGVELAEESAEMLADLAMAMMQTAAHCKTGDEAARTGVVYRMLLAYADRLAGEGTEAQTNLKTERE